MGLPHTICQKKDGSLHLCVDYQALNKVTQKDHYTLPLIADLLHSLGPDRIYTKIWWNIEDSYYHLRGFKSTLPMWSPYCHGRNPKMFMMYNLFWDSPISTDNSSMTTLKSLSH